MYLCVDKMDNIPSHTYIFWLLCEAFVDLLIFLGHSFRLLRQEPTNDYAREKILRSEKSQPILLGDLVYWSVLNQMYQKQQQEASRIKASKNQKMEIMGRNRMKVTKTKR